MRERQPVHDGHHAIGKHQVAKGIVPHFQRRPLQRLRQFEQDPQPVPALLELLKDDVSPYVRRSVANNLSDIGKDHPALRVAVARTWLRDASPQRDQLVRHALRSAIKRAAAAAFHAIGDAEKPEGEVNLIDRTPAQPVIGGSIGLLYHVISTAGQAQKLLVDLEVGYMKASGECKPKVFKFRMLELAPGKTITLKENSRWCRCRRASTIRAGIRWDASLMVMPIPWAPLR